LAPPQKPHRPALAQLVTGGFLGPQTDIKVVYYIFPVQQQATRRDLIPALANQAGFLQHFARDGLVGGFTLVHVPGGHFEGDTAQWRPVLLHQDDSPLRVENEPHHPVGAHHAVIGFRGSTGLGAGVYHRNLKPWGPKYRLRLNRHWYGVWPLL